MESITVQEVDPKIKALEDKLAFVERKMKDLLKQNIELEQFKKTTLAGKKTEPSSSVQQDHLLQQTNDQINSLHQQITLLQSQLQDGSKLIRESNIKLTANSQRIQELEEKNILLTSQLAEQTENFTKSLQDNEKKFKSELENLKETKEKDIQSKENQINELNSKFNEYLAKKDELELQYQQSEALVKKLKENIDFQVEKNAELQKQVNIAESKFIEQMQVNKDQAILVEQLGQQVSKSSKLLLDTELVDKSLKEEKDFLMNQVREKDEEIQSLKFQLEQMEQRINHFTTQINEQNQSLTQLSDLQIQSRKNLERANELDQLLSMSINDAANMKAKIDELTDIITDKDQKIRDLELELSNASNFAPEIQMPENQKPELQKGPIFPNPMRNTTPFENKPRVAEKKRLFCTMCGSTEEKEKRKCSLFWIS
jgi:chromosome segregation ATPase